MIWLLIVLLIVVPIGWLVSEFQPRVWLRISLGFVALAMSYFVAFVAGSLTQLNYNAWYGSASADLIDTVIASVETGNEETLLRELKRLKKEYQPTYENRANYDKLVKEFVDRMETTSQERAAGDEAETSE